MPQDEAPVVLFCPGTSGNLSSHLYYVELLCRAGCAVLSVDYTGFRSECWTGVAAYPRARPPVRQQFSLPREARPGLRHLWYVPWGESGAAGCLTAAGGARRGGGGPGTVWGDHTWRPGRWYYGAT